MNQDLAVFSLTIGELKTALAENRFWKSQHKVIPFTKSKARWLLKNERANDDDVCAILGYENDELVSFIYLIADWIEVDKEIQKVFWSRRWWISENHKNSILPTYTNNLSQSVSKNRTVIKFLGKAVVPFYTKQPFKTFATRTRSYIVFNVDSDLLFSKIPRLKNIGFIFNFFDKISLAISTNINKLKVRKKTTELTYDYIQTITTTDWIFLEPFLKNDFIKKTASFLNWQIDNNQYSIALVNEKNRKMCLINSLSNRIYNTSFFVYNNDVKIGFISAIIRDREFNIRYFICDEKHFKLCANALLENFLSSKTTRIQTENEKLALYLRKNFFSVFTDTREIYSLIHNSIAEKISKTQVFDQDGHFA